MTETRALVSIVIPCFNYAVYLAEAIESALGQTYSDVEVIVVDDGSTDDSLVTAKRYPVRVLSQSNSGLSVSSNNGIRAARGEYVVRLDADDVLYPRFVEETIGALSRAEDAVLVHTGAEYFGTRRGRVPFVPFDGEALAQGAYATGTALFRRSALEAVGGFDEDIPLNEDWDLWLAFVERGLHGVMIPEPLWGYRQHGPSMVKRPVRSLRDVRREYRLVSILQDNHPRTFAPGKLVRRLCTVPRRVLVRQLAAPIAARLTILYGIMLCRAVLRIHRPRERQARDFGRSGEAVGRVSVEV